MIVLLLRVAQFVDDPANSFCGGAKRKRKRKRKRKKEREREKRERERERRQTEKIDNV